MKPGDAEYTALVEQKRAEIRGNISSVKMSEAEISKEIADIQDGAKSSFSDGSELAIMETLEGADLGLKLNADGSMEGFPIKKKRGRPLGSRNKPKV